MKKEFFTLAAAGIALLIVTSCSSGAVESAVDTAVSGASQVTCETLTSESEASAVTEESIIETETEPLVLTSDEIYIELIPEGGKVISVKLSNETDKDIEDIVITPDADMSTGKADVEIIFADGDATLLMGIKLSDIEEGDILWDDDSECAYIVYTSLQSGSEIDTLTMSPEETYEETTETTRRSSNADSGCIGDGGLTY